MQNVCRTCMSDSVPLVNIFSDVRDPALDQTERNLSYILSECTNRPVRWDDCLPKFICLSCVQAAQAAFRFKQQFDRSFQHFCELQKKDPLKEDPDQENRKKASKAESSQCNSSLEEHGGTNNRKSKVLDETERDNAVLPRASKKCTRKDMNNQNRTQNIVNVDGKRFECSHCHKIYKHRYNLKRHLITHTSEPNHKCPYCLKAYWRRDTYIGHLATHGIRTPVFCKQCPMICPDATLLEVHQRDHNAGAQCVAKDLPLLKSSDIRTHDEEGPHACRQCSAIFIERIQLEIHQREHKEKTAGEKLPVPEDSDSE